MNLAVSAVLSILLPGAGLFPPAADPIRDAQWHLGYLNVAAAHAIAQGEGVVVAVLDTGVDGGHPDLAGSFVPGADLVGDRTGDGLTDLDGHGTAVAGLIASHGRSLGLAPKAGIMSVRFTPSSNGFESVAAAMDWAIDHGADVICDAGGELDNPLLRDAVRRAINANIVVVAAAGNAPRDRTVIFPAAYPGVVAVSGTDRNGNHDSGSVSGAQVTLAAPSVEIASTDLVGEGRTGYAVSGGTSDATAIVAGAAALVRSKYPNLSGPEVVRRLTETADDKGPPGRDNDYGYGVVNLVKALTADIPPLQPSSPPVSTGTPNAQPPTGTSTSPLVYLLGGTVLLLLLAGGYVAWRRLRT